MSEIKITALIENKAPEGLTGEHGLAVHIQYGVHSILLDTGASPAFADNAEKLGIDLSGVELAVLSHSHFDHSGGFGAFFKMNKSANLYMRAEGKELCFSRPEAEKRYIGFPTEVMDSCSDRFVFVSEHITKLLDGVWLVSHSTPELEKRGKAANMYRQTEKGYVPDDFAHEQSLVFETGRGLIVLNSCCHGGADNVVREVLEAFPGKNLYMLIGGFHLMGAEGVSSLGVTPEYAKTLSENILALGVDTVCTGHCTGEPGFALVQEAMGSRVRYFMTGDVIEF